jgi:hypothetical protein
MIHVGFRCCPRNPELLKGTDISVPQMRRCNPALAAGVCFRFHPDYFRSRFCESPPWLPSSERLTPARHEK